MILSKPNHIKIYGHRGARGDLPENTLESFKYLFDNNINAYETDILVTEENFSSFLSTSAFKDPDLCIRTGNEIRVSNFLLWQLAYAEIFFEKKLWIFLGLQKGLPP